MILDEMISRHDRQTFVSLHHSGDEIYSRGESYIISAGGHPAPTLYPYHGDQGTIAAIAVGTTSVVGTPLAGAATAAIAASIKAGDDDARGVSVPTTLLPAGRFRDRDSLLRFEGTAGQDSTNMCVAPNFACGQALQIPGYMVSNRSCYVTRPDKAPGSQWTFVDFSGSCSPMKPLGFYLAIWYQYVPQGNGRRADGFFEVYNRTDDGTIRKEPETSERPGGSMEASRIGAIERGKQLERPGTSMERPGTIKGNRPEAPPSRPSPIPPNPASGTLTFSEFTEAVMARNGNKNFSIGTNDGPNAYTTLAGAQIGFQVNPGIILGRPAQGLPAAAFLFTPTPRIILTPT